MAVTVQLLRELQQEAAGLSAESLRETIAENAAILDDLIDTADTYASVRHLCWEDEARFQCSFSEVESALMIIAVLTTELTKRPVVLAAFSPN